MRPEIVSFSLVMYFDSLTISTGMFCELWYTKHWLLNHNYSSHFAPGLHTLEKKILLKVYQVQWREFVLNWTSFGEPYLCSCIYEGIEILDQRPNESFLFVWFLFFFSLYPSECSDKIMFFLSLSLNFLGLRDYSIIF